jgi:tetratricopeptide (TPR) repeat protein
MMRTQRFITALAISSLALLSACKTDVGLAKPIDSLMGKREATEARLSTAAAAAIAQGRAQEALARYEELYNGHARSAEVAVNYAQLLRKTGKIDRAEEVLKPFVRGRNSDVRRAGFDGMVYNEYAAILIAKGDFAGAESILNGVLEDAKAGEFHHDARNLMGVSLDARGQHKEAEQMFRLALDGWQGNPSSVMNNLGLCLASEGMFDESLDTLRRALILAPDKEEIAKNIQIVTALRDKVVKKPSAAPVKKVPAKKTAAKPKPKATPCPATCLQGQKDAAPTSAAPADSAVH